MTCRTALGLLVLAFGVGVGAVAQAQPAEPPAPPPTEGAQPEETPAGTPAEGTDPAAPAEEGEGEEKPEEEPPPPAVEEPAPPPVAPAPAPETAPAAAPPPAPPAAEGSIEPTPDGPDEVEEKSEKLPPRVPWRGTSLRWSNTATTTALGIGRDNIGSSHEMYLMSWGLMLNYYLADQDDWKLNVYTMPGFSVELTNSDYTTTENEPQFDDLPLGLNYSRTLYATDDGSFVTSGSGSMVLIFPTSPLSYDVGTYLTTSPRLSFSQSFPLFGQDAPAFQGFAVGISGRWDHRFGDATTAVNPDLDRPRQDNTGSSFLSDQISFGRLASDTLREGIFLAFPSSLPGDMELTISGAFSFSQSFKPEFESTGCDVELATGCVEADTDPDARDSQNGVGFSAAIQFFPVSEAGLSLAYINSSSQLGPDGERRNIFYSPGAMFSLDLLISIDAIYERIIGPSRQGSMVMAKNKKKQQLQSPASILF